MRNHTAEVLLQAMTSVPMHQPTKLTCSGLVSIILIQQVKYIEIPLSVPYLRWCKTLCKLIQMPKRHRACSSKTYEELPGEGLLMIIMLRTATAGG